MTRRHSRTIDMTQVPPAERDLLQEGLNRVTYPVSRIHARTGAKVPVTVADLSRYNAELAQSAHAHVHREEDGEHVEGHLLGSPVGNAAAGGENRAAALGLFWLPTSRAPAGSIQIDEGAIRENTDLAREVLVAELAHAVDYGAMTDDQRAQIVTLFDYQGTGPAAQGWFEEQGEQDYWRWRGERFMGLFCAAFAPTLPRVLEGAQPWQYSYDASDVRAVRRILR